MGQEPTATPSAGNTDPQAGQGTTPQDTPATGGEQAKDQPGAKPQADGKGKEQPGTDPAPEAGKPGEQPPAGEHWSDQVEFLKGNELARKYKTPEDMLKAHKELQEKVEGMGEPVTDPTKFELKLPDGLTADEGMMGWFKEQAAQRGWSNEKAQDVMDAYIAKQVVDSQEAASSFEETMKTEWGEKYKDNLRLVNEQIGFMDAAIAQRFNSTVRGQFQKWVTSSPLVGSNPNFARMMLLLKQAVSPEAVTGGANVAPAGKREMSAEEYLTHQRKEQRVKRD